MKSVFTRAAQGLARALSIPGRPSAASTHTIHDAFREEEEKWQVHEWGNVRLFNDSRAFALFNADQSLIPDFFSFREASSEFNPYIQKSKHFRPKRFPHSILSLHSTLSRRNYFHWFFDVLPRLHLFRMAHPGVSPDYYLFPGSLNRPYRTQTLDLLDIPASQRLVNDKNCHLICKKIYVTDHPRKLTFRARPPVRTWICQFLQETFRPFVEKRDSLPRKIYISRGDSYTGGRQVTNDLEVLELLNKYDIQPVNLSHLSFLDQLSLFAHAELITGVHGAGFANTVFCRPGTGVLEIYNENYCTQSYSSIAEKCRLNYLPAIQTNVAPAEQHHMGNVTVDIRDLQNKVETALAN